MPPSAKSSLFYGWKLCFLSMFVAFIVTGSSVYLMNALIEPLEALYGWHRGEIGLVQGIGSFCGMACAPFLASLAMRTGLRRVMLAGIIAGSIGFFLLGRTSSFVFFGMAFCLLWIGGQACGGPISTALMSNWFIRHRGRTFGLVSVGMTFSGAVLPFAALVILALFSIRATLDMLGCISLLVLFPLVWFMVRDTPEEMGLLPDGEEPFQGGKEHQEIDDPHAHDPRPTVGELFRSPLVLRIGFAFALGLLSAAGTMGQLKPRFSDLGHGDFLAMGFACATAFFAASGKYVWGAVADRISPLLAAKRLLFCNFASALLAFLPSNLFTLGLYVLCAGLSMGGFWAVLPALTAHIFGRKHFMAVYRVMTFFTLANSLGYFIVGFSHHLTGSYDASTVIFCIFFLAGLLLLPGKNAQYQPPKPAKPR